MEKKSSLIALSVWFSTHQVCQAPQAIIHQPKNSLGTNPMNPQLSNLQYYHWETYTDRKMIKIHGQHTQFNADSQEESPPDSINSWKSNPNNFHCDPNGERKQYIVQCMEAKVGSLCGWKKTNYRPAISAREKGRTPTQRLVKTFYSPVLHEEDERPRSEGVGRSNSHVVERRASVAW